MDSTIDSIKKAFKQLKTYLKPIKGHGTIGMFQRTIVYSEWVLIGSVVLSIVLECINTNHNGWIQFIENYAIGIACSVVIVLVTVITQFISTRDKAFEQFYPDLFQMLFTFYQAVDEKKNANASGVHYYINLLEKDLKRIRIRIDDLFWFNLKYETPFSYLYLKLTCLTLKQRKEYPPKDIYVEEKDVIDCITHAKKFMNLIRPQYSNMFEIFDDEINEGENNDQL